LGAVLEAKTGQYICFLVAGETIASRINLAADAILQEEAQKYRYMDGISIL
jgi:hypothetical protein